MLSHKWMISEEFAEGAEKEHIDSHEPHCAQQQVVENLVNLATELAYDNLVNPVIELVDDNLVSSTT